ncbi:phosphodiesterase [Streptomyces sp. 4N509B]|uniref:phosphodiesterase n=1 Tax=Streptomyces sp. 4N509B TaxID=3457413 RepID=UPI003FD4613C
MPLLAHISDLHLDGTPRASARARRVVDHLRTLPQPVDAVLVTGDIADHGDPAEYEEAARLLAALPYPVLTCPGNHDARAAFRKALLDEPPSEEPINRLHHVADTAILMCDSTIPGRDEGLLDDDTLAWIDATLSDLPTATPALLAFHQPPVALHHPLPDSMNLLRPHDLAALLRSHPNVAAVLTGHAHTAAASTFAGRPVVVGPAVTWTLRMAWEGEGAADREQPPGLAFHILATDGDGHEDGDGDGDGGGEGLRLTTHFRVLPLDAATAAATAATADTAV